MERTCIYRVTGIKTIERWQAGRPRVSERIAMLAKLPDTSHWQDLPATIDLASDNIAVNALVRIRVEEIDIDTALKHPGLSAADKALLATPQGKGQ